MKRNLGFFDMVLALSINKINSEFDFLLERKKVSKQWGFMVDKQGEHFVNDNKTFAGNLAAWKAVFDPKVAIQLKDLQSQIDAAIKAKNWAQVEKLQADKEALEKTQDPDSPFRQYDYALDAKIKCFTIELAKAEGIASAPLYFIIEMEAGTLYYKTYNDSLKTFEIQGKTFKNANYAFKVNVGTKIIKTAEMELSDKDRDDLIVKNGITDADFEVMALLMDFQNANISQYAKERTTIFDQIKGADVELIGALTLYFKHLAGTKDNPNPHPFILGYKVEERTQKLTPALFNPTAIMHSTTDTKIALDKDHNDPNYQSFNYLMQTANHKLPDEATRGMLPYNLIETLDDKSITTSGVFAIDYSTFVQKYINEVLEPQLYSKMAETMAANLNDMSVSNNGSAIYCSKPDLYFDVKLENKSISQVNYQQKKGIKISWDITIEGKQHIEVERTFGGTVGSHMFISTSGAFKVVPEGKKEKDVEAARPGKLEIILTASQKGTLSLESNYVQPYVGTTTKKPIPDDPSFSWGDFLDFALALLPLTAIIGTIIRIFGDFSFHIDLANADFGKFNMGSFEGFKSRVILPGSNTFTFKTVRLLNGSQNEDDAVLFDIAYVPFEDQPQK